MNAASDIFVGFIAIAGLLVLLLCFLGLGALTYQGACKTIEKRSCVEQNLDVHSDECQKRLCLSCYECR